MRRAFTELTIEISAREIELLAKLSREFKDLAGLDLAYYEKLAEKLGESGAAVQMPRGYRYKQYAEVLEQFENLYEFGEPILPF